MAEETKDGGKPDQKPVMNYQPPVGPTQMYYESPGNHGTNYGNCGSQGKR